VQEGDDVAGFEVVHLPGHAPWLIGLWRASDRVVPTDLEVVVDGTRAA